MASEWWSMVRYSKKTTTSKRTAFTNWVMSFHTGNATNAQTIHTLHIRISYGGAFELFFYFVLVTMAKMYSKHIRKRKIQRVQKKMYYTALHSLTILRHLQTPLHFLVLIRTQFSIVREFLCQRAIIFREH